MAKRGRNQKSGNRNPKKLKANTNVGLEDMDDEVDVFHKQRDKIPLDMNDDSAKSNDEQPVFNYKDSGEDDCEADEDEDEDEDEEDDDDDDEGYDKALAKIERTQKYLKAKHGNLEDDLLDDAEEDTEDKGLDGEG